MSAFLELKPENIITAKYKAYPSYSLTLNGEDDSSYYSSNLFYIETEENVSYGASRSYFDIRGEYITGSWNLSGAVEFIRNDAVSALEKRSLNRLRNIYASASFIREYNYTSSSVFSASKPENQYMSFINIPSILYGTEIRPGSFSLAVPGAITLTDDGFGGILSNSVLIGSIYYQHGLVVLGHKSQAFESYYNGSNLTFSGTTVNPITMYICSAPHGAMNFSNNPSFFVENTSSNKNEITTTQPETFITSIGLYDEDYNLLGVAKVAKPIMNKEETSIQFRLKLNF